MQLKFKCFRDGNYRESRAIQGFSPRQKAVLDIHSFKFKKNSCLQRQDFKSKTEK